MLPLERPHGREPHPVSTATSASGCRSRAVPAVRPRSLPGHRRRRPVGAGWSTPTPERPLSLRETAGAGLQLPPQLGQGGGGRLRRHRDVLRRRSRRSDRRTYARHSPACSGRCPTMPADLRAHIRYPDTSSRCRPPCSRPTTCGSPVFYNKEDLWEDPALPQLGASAMEPYYTIMRLPGEQGGVHPDARPSPRAAETTWSR